MHRKINKFTVRKTNFSPDGCISGPLNDTEVLITQVFSKLNRSNLGQLLPFISIREACLLQSSIELLSIRPICVTLSPSLGRHASCLSVCVVYYLFHYFLGAVCVCSSYNKLFFFSNLYPASLQS